ncbi:MAG TPA: outer membrane beta-barrel domain-containing protein [Anaeromyxobacteraceae bacterium]|nr:outer membrane beta-barrel domain-containing protein [Anaeromyxobacteraceae bacterium]
MSARTAIRAALAAAALLAAPLAEASEADAFENKIEPISGQLYTKAGKVELEGLFALSLNDAFYTKYFGGVRVGYHFSDFWSVAVTGQAGASSPTSSTTLCTPSQGCKGASAEQLWRAPGDLKWIAGAEVLFAPVYGKVNIVGSAVLHLDFSILAGVDWIESQKVLTPQQASAGVPPGNVGAPAVHFGLGSHIFVAPFAALTVELKDYLYFTDVNTGYSTQANTLQSQLFLELGISFFVGGGR